MLGQNGYESNKQSAIYELPTKELLDGIYNIMKVYKLDSIEEIMSGMGLLSFMFKKYEGLHVHTTDGCKLTPN